MKKWSALSITLKTYLTLLAAFSLFRLILFFSWVSRADTWPGFADSIRAFLMGLRFDLVISGYLLFFPMLILYIYFTAGKNPGRFFRIMFWIIFLAGSLALIVCAADIPYFLQFFSRFSVSAFQWTENTSFVFKMIVEEPRYFLMLIPLSITIFLLYKALNKIFKAEEPGSRLLHPALRVLLSLVLIGLIFAGIRGRLNEKAPIKTGTAYFGNDPFLNQLGLNPVFTLMRSWFDLMDDRNRNVELIDEKQAVENVRNYLGIQEPVGEYPIARRIEPDSTGERRFNVILVIMESMSAAKMTRHGNHHNLTPFLDSLSYEGLYFGNIFTAGIHTFNGVFSTLFSFPAIYRQNPMKESTIYRYNGIGNVLKNSGYSTAYFTTHDGQFDNIEGFLRANDFEEVIELSEYPDEMAKTTLGVPDDYMFEFAMPILDEYSGRGKPFFATFMTASDHSPYYLPGYFKPRRSALKEQIVEYADWSLRKLVMLAREKEWFRNTVFVFVADHGAAIDPVYEIPLNYHHTPLLFYSPELIPEPAFHPEIGGQIDVFPTIMGLLNLPYVNNTLGIDLLRGSRPYILINHEDKVGVIGREHLLIVRNDGTRLLYLYEHGDRRNYHGDYPAVAEEMERYAFSNLQTFQLLTKSPFRYFE
jgi:phosphoglycerol transferase MdoB-like AlkP superfamily enzyme